MKIEEIRNLISSYGFCEHLCYFFDSKDTFDVDGCEDFCIHINEEEKNTFIKIWGPTYTYGSEYSSDMIIKFSELLVSKNIEEIGIIEIENIFKNIIKKYYELKKELRKYNLEKYLDEK